MLEFAARAAVVFLMATYDLSPAETRVLGCLLEKERTTPENYPLSLNALVAACNQTTNRDPVVAFDERTVEDAVNTLREKKLATVVFGAGSRVQKYRHNLLDHFELDPAEVALICVLFLRGPQTPGELRARTERMHRIASVPEVETTLETLAAGDSPLVRMLPPRPGQKERRYVQLFSAESAGAEQTAPATDRAPSRLEALEQEVAALKTEVADLRHQLTHLKTRFNLPPEEIGPAPGDSALPL